MELTKLGYYKRSAVISFVVMRLAENEWSKVWSVSRIIP